MSSTLLEVTRGSHEEVERLERLIATELQSETASSRDRLFQSHRVRFMIEHIISTTDKLVIFPLFFSVFESFQFVDSALFVFAAIICLIFGVFDC